MLRRAFFVLFFTAVFITACNKPPAGQQQGMNPVVVIDSVMTEYIAHTNSYLGKLDAGSKATITARVNGYLENRLINEGDMVKKDQLLFVIEKKQYHAAVKQAEAALAQANAQANNTTLQKKRAEELIKTGSIPRATYDNAVAADTVAKANVTAASAALDAALLNYRYTDITAPIAGKIGFINFHPGETVGPASGPLATIIAAEPMYVTFSISEKQLQIVKKEYNVQTSDALTQAVKDNAILQLVLSDGSIYKHSGAINFTDNAINAGTDSIRVRGIFPNKEGLLTHGQTVTVNLVNVAKNNYIVIPKSAIMSDLRGKFVFVAVFAENSTATVERRDLELGSDLRDGRQVVNSGLNEGDKLIVDGLQKIRPGIAVTALTLQQYGEFMKNMAAQAAGGR